MTTEYNGWTNYATWRVNLEMFDGADWASDNDLDAYDLGQLLRGITEDHLASQTYPGLTLAYALAFISDVNWREIAQHQIADYRDGESAE